MPGGRQPWLGTAWRWLKHAAEVAAPILSAVAALAAVLIAGITLRSTSAAQNAEAFSTAVTALSETNEADPRSREAQHLGGIFSLQGVMDDDPRRQPAVVAVLAAFVQAQRRTGAEVRDSFWRPPDTGCAPRAGVAPNAAPPTDVQAAFDVLARRNPGSDSPRAQLELSVTCLAYMPASGAQMPQARLTGADLNHAILSGANLAGINGISLNLASADLTASMLDRADLRAANLGNLAQARGASLREARLNGADLSDIDLTGADLTSAQLSAFDSGADGTLCREQPQCYLLPPANLARAKLDGADLTGVDLGGVVLIGASMKNTHVDAGQLSRLDREQASQVTVN